MALAIDPITGLLGAEISGVDLRDELDGEPGGGFDRVLALLGPDDRAAVERMAA